MNLTKTFLAMVFGVISCAWLFLLPVAKADDMPTLDAWVGKYPNTVIDGINFFDHVAFYWAEKQGIPPDKIKKIATFPYHQPIVKIDNVLILQGASCDRECASKPGFFAVAGYSLLIDLTQTYPLFNRTKEQILEPSMILCLQTFQREEVASKAKYTNLVQYFADNGEGREINSISHNDNNGGCMAGNEFYESEETFHHLLLLKGVFQHLRFSGTY